MYLYPMKKIILILTIQKTHILKLLKNKNLFLRKNRTLVEADILLCDAGELGVRKVLHSVISTPFRHINQKNLSRLDVINTQVFNAANKSGIKVLAMPLIGTGKLH